MQYTLNTSNYHTFPVFEVNKLPPRSYFIPYPARPEADAVSLTEKRYRSPKVRCLNGLWDFKFYPRPAELHRHLCDGTGIPAGHWHRGLWTGHCPGIPV